MPASSATLRKIFPKKLVHALLYLLCSEELLFNFFVGYLQMLSSSNIYIGWCRQGWFSESSTLLKKKKVNKFGAQLA